MKVILLGPKIQELVVGGSLLAVLLLEELIVDFALFANMFESTDVAEPLIKLSLLKFLLLIKGGLSKDFGTGRSNVLLAPSCKLECKFELFFRGYEARLLLVSS